MSPPSWGSFSWQAAAIAPQLSPPPWPPPLPGKQCTVVETESSQAGARVTAKVMVASPSSVQVKVVLAALACFSTTKRSYFPSGQGLAKRGSVRNTSSVRLSRKAIRSAFSLSLIAKPGTSALL